MSEQIKDGGSAFPVMLQDIHSGEWMAIAGMSLRDYFAAKAMQGAMVNATGLGGIEASELHELLFATAGICYAVADAMLSAREATP